MGQSITGVRNNGVILAGLNAFPGSTSMLVVSSAGVMEAQDLPVPYTGAAQDVDLNGRSLTARTITAQATAAADVVGTFRGTTSQSGDLIQCRDTSGIVASISYFGGMTSRYFVWGAGGGSPVLMFRISGTALTSPATTGTGLATFVSPFAGYGLAHSGNAWAGTSGAFQHIFQSLTVSPTSGTATYTAYQVTPTINQTGGASGITRGFYANPVLTAAADWRSFQSTNNTGYAFYGSGTAPSQFNGDVVSAALMCAGAYTVGTLPSASANAGKFCQVTDSSVTTFGSTVAGGGSNRRQVFSDGTNWIIH